MSHSLPRRIRNGASTSFAAAISSRLPADVVGVEPGNDADVARVVADRQVLVAERLCRPAHLLDRRLAVRGGRVDVQVAADVRQLEQVGRRIARRRARGARVAETDG